MTGGVVRLLVATAMTMLCVTATARAKKLDALGRFNAVMNAPDLFTVEPLPPAQAQAK